MTSTTNNEKEAAKDGNHADVTLDQMAHVAARLKAIAGNLGRDKDYEAIAPTLDQCSLGIFKLVVLGEIKKGKSSLINALLGEDTPVVPVAEGVATSTVFKIIYGSERITKVFYQPDLETGLEKPPLQIRDEEVIDYGTETGNPDNIKGVDFIGIELPNIMLSTGLVIIDTPGLGGLVKTHRDITWRYLPNADAVCFVTDSVSEVLNNHEIGFLEELVSRVTRRLFFVQTKTDVTADETVVAWRERNIEILRDKLGLQENQIRYFCVSSVSHSFAKENKDMKLAAMSGYPQLRRFIDDGLLKLKDRELVCRCAALLAPVAATLATEITNRLAIVAADNEQGVKDLKSEFEKSRNELLHLRSQEVPRLKMVVQEGLGRLRTRLDDKFSAALVETLDSFQTKLEKKPAEDLIKTAEKIGPAMSGEANRVIVMQSKMAIQEINEFFEELFGVDVPGSDNAGEVKSIARNAAKVELGEHGSADIMAAIQGGGLGVGALAVVAKVAVLTFNPVLAIGAALGGIWLMLSRQKGKKREELLQKSKGAARDVQARARDLWQRELRSMIEDASATAQRSIVTMVDSKQSALDANLKELGERRGKSDGQIRNQKAALEETLKEITDCRERITAMI